MVTNLKPSHRFFHTLCIRPNIRFEAQFEGEEVILVLRAHPITQLPWIINTVFLIIILIALNFFFFPYLTDAQNIILNVFGAVFIFSYAWINILRWAFNVGIVTNERILDVDFHSILYREITATKLEKASDVTAKIGGFFGSLFQFGDVFVKTEGAEQNIEFDDIPQPSDVVIIINNLIRGD